LKELIGIIAQYFVRIDENWEDVDPEREFTDEQLNDIYRTQFYRPKDFHDTYDDSRMAYQEENKLQDKIYDLKQLVIDSYDTYRKLIQQRLYI
jgi:hypothetical protein